MDLVKHNVIGIDIAVATHQQIGDQRNVKLLEQQQIVALDPFNVAYFDYHKRQDMRCGECLPCVHGELRRRDTHLLP